MVSLLERVEVGFDDGDEPVGWGKAFGWRWGGGGGGGGGGGTWSLLDSI